MFFSALLLSGCASGRMSGNPGAVMAGASIGGTVGSAIGGIIGENHGWRGGRRGSAIGTIVGTIAGAAIGNAASTPRQQQEGYVPQPQPQRSAPVSDLRIRNLRFIDDNRNHVIDSDENSKVIFEIVNEGRSTVYNVVPIVEETTGMKNIYISPSVMIEQINPGEGIRYTATIYAGKKLKNGEAVLRVAVADEGNEAADWQEFTLPTQRR